MANLHDIDGESEENDGFVDVNMEANEVEDENEDYEEESKPNTEGSNKDDTRSIS